MTRIARLLLAGTVAVAPWSGCGDHAGSTPGDADLDAAGADVATDAAPSDAAATDADASAAPSDAGDAGDAGVSEATDSVDPDSLEMGDSHAGEDGSADAGDGPGGSLEDGAAGDVDDGSGADAPVARCEGRADFVRMGDLEPSADWGASTAPACGPSGYTAVIPSGVTWTVEARGLPADARLFVFGPSYGSVGGATGDLTRTDFAGEAGTLEVRFTSAAGGEQFLVLERDDASEPLEYELRATCVDGCDRETTRFPVVLVHGYAGVDSYFGVLDYFYDVAPTLGRRGFVVYTPVTDAIATSERRAGQLAAQVDEILKESQARAVNIIAHSQGGLDARYLVSTLGYGDRVASITTLATPHRGIGAVLFDFLSAQSFDPDDMEAFNRENPDDPRVRYWSWSARSCGLVQFGCQRNSSGETVDLLLTATHTLLLRFGENDGIVPTASMAWGEHLGMVYADHFDEVGQIADGSPSRDPFDHRAFYLGEARRLRAAGL